MNVETFQWDGVKNTFPLPNADVPADLVIYFADPEKVEFTHNQLRKNLPDAVLMGCSTGGQFSGQSPSDSAVIYAVLDFETTIIKSASALVDGNEDSSFCGANIGAALAADNLAAVLVLSDGTGVNGSELAHSLSETVGQHVPIFGGLAGDADRFEKTIVGLNDKLQSGMVVAVGLYGDDIVIGNGSRGGWQPFGPRRQITKSSGNVLYELDGQPALELYEKYLGEEAANLPASALLYPLQITQFDDEGSAVVRTILNIDRDAGSLIFAGNVPEGSVAQLMKTSNDSLTSGAAEAAMTAVQNNPNSGFALMVSCIGRRLLMGQYSEDEVEAAGEILSELPRIGFYSYGEICPRDSGGAPQLHNQTMTISVISEISKNAAA